MKPKRSSSSARPFARQHEVKLFALISLGCFLAGLVLVWVLIVKAELLVRLGLVGKLYYLVLLPLGLAAAGFLFGVLRSFAAFRGKVLNGVLRLGGPVVAFGLVVLGGFWLAPSPTPFSVTVFVHGEGGVQDIPLRRHGRVVLDLGADRRIEAIGDKGEASFSGIPESFRGQEAPISLMDADGFAPIDANGRQRLDGPSLYLAVRRQAVTLQGRVQDGEGRPVHGANLRVRELTATSDPEGLFHLEIPGGLVGENLSLSISAPGFEPWHETVTPGSNDLVVTLQRAEP